MNSCPNCGAPVNDGAAFCTSCGTKLETVTASDTPPAESPAAASPSDTPTVENPAAESPTAAVTPDIPAVPGKPKKKKFLLLAIPVLAVLTLLVFLFQNGTLGSSSAKASKAILGHWECDTLYLNNDEYDAAVLGGVSCDVSDGSLTVTHGLSYFDDLTMYWEVNEDSDSTVSNADYRYSLSSSGILLGSGAVDGDTFYLALFTESDLIMYVFSRG